MCERASVRLRACVRALVLRRERGRVDLQRICGFTTHGPFKGLHLELQALPGARAVSEEREQRSQLGGAAARSGRTPLRRHSGARRRWSRSTLLVLRPRAREPASAAVRRHTCPAHCKRPHGFAPATARPAEPRGFRPRPSTGPEGGVLRMGHVRAGHRCAASLLGLAPRPGARPGRIGQVP